MKMSNELFSPFLLLAQLIPLALVGLWGPSPPDPPVEGGYNLFNT